MQLVQRLEERKGAKRIGLCAELPAELLGGGIVAFGARGDEQSARRKRHQTKDHFLHARFPFLFVSFFGSSSLPGTGATSSCGATTAPFSKSSAVGKRVRL